MKAVSPEFIRFVAVGGVAAAVNIASRYLINYIVGYSTAIVLAYLLGMLTAFFLSKQYVFVGANRHSTRAQFLRFALVNVFAAAQVWAISIGLAEYVFPALHATYHPFDIAHLIGVIFPVFTSFLGHKYFSFRTKSEPQCN